MDYQTACVIAPVSQSKLEEVQFPKVHYYPDGQVPDDILAVVDIWYTTWTGLPDTVTSLSQIPNTKVVQLSSGGRRQDGA